MTVMGAAFKAANRERERTHGVATRRTATMKQQRDAYEARLTLEAAQKQALLKAAFYQRHPELIA